MVVPDGDVAETGRTGSLGDAHCLVRSEFEDQHPIGREPFECVINEVMESLGALRTGNQRGRRLPVGDLSRQMVVLARRTAGC